MVTRTTKGEQVHNAGMKAGLQLDPDLTVDEWASQYRMMTSKGSAEPGLWRNERTPYLQEIMQCLSANHSCDYVVFVAGTQVGKTEVLLNWSGEIIHLMPGPMLIVTSTLSSGEIFSKQRLQPMIDETPVLFERVSKSRERDSGNTLWMKEFGGGSINITTGNSEDSLRSKPVRFMGLDEVDMYKGWTVSKAIERTETFSNRKIFLCSSPKKKESSIITAEYELSDQRKFFVPCPHCGSEQVLEFGGKNADFGLKFKHEEYKLVGEVEYLCKFCKCMIAEHYKPKMINAGRWVAQNDVNGQYPGFHLNQLYSILGKSKWRSAARKFLKFSDLKKRDNVTYIDLQETFTNDVLALAWEKEVGKAQKWETLFNRREDYKIEPLDEKILCLTAGVDVQDDRLEVQVLGHALDFETFVVEVKSFYGKLSSLELWSHLDEFLLKPYTHKCGKQLRIMCTAIDTGGHDTQRVYDFVKSRYIPEKRYVFGIKGASIYNQPIVQQPSKNKGINLFSIGTDTAKTHIHRCLNVVNAGASYVHFPLSLPEPYFKQLCAEKLVTEWNKGKRREVWKNTSHARNEALDTFVYAFAALHIMQYWLHPNKTVTEMLQLFALNQDFSRQNAPNMVSDGKKVQDIVHKRQKRGQISKGVTV